MSAPPILSHLSDVRQTGDTQWLARCPSHEDRTSSLSVGKGDDGRTLLYCQAGCPTATVVRAAGLTMRDLAPTNGHANGYHAPQNGNGQTLEGSWWYRDANGNRLKQVLKYRNPDGSKTFKQRKPKPGGGWEYKVRDVPEVPYRLPELLNSDGPVFIPEGEKDCDRLADLGLTATCNAGGAGKWRREHATYLMGRDVVVLADNDDPGRKHAQQVADLCRKADAKSVKILELPDLPVKGDVSDWLDSGGTRDALERLVEDCPEWSPELGANLHEVNGEDGFANLQNHNGIGKLSEPLQRTDLGNARRMVERFGGKLRYVGTWNKWLAWDGTRWKRDDTGEVDRLAQETSRSIFDEARDEPDQSRRNDLAKWAISSQSRGKLEAMIALAATQPEVAISHDQLNRHPYLLNCPNGTVDLRTGELLPHDPGHLLTQVTGASYPTSVDPPELWIRTLERIMGGNRGMITYLRRLCGVALIGEVLEHCLPIFHGVGANGKSLTVESLMSVLGDYATKAPRGFGVVSRHEEHPTAIADLYGKRLVVITETGEGQRLDESLIKELTGGDTIRARRMREDYWQFTPAHTLLMVTNHAPAVRGLDHGIWRRLQMVPFNVVIPPEEQDKDLPRKLKAEYGAILRWMVEGTRLYLRDGLRAPEEVTSATDQYRTEMDSFALFISDRCTLMAGYSVRSSDLLANYSRWCDEQGMRAVNGTIFGKRMMALPGVDKHRSNGPVYTGVGLNA